MVYSTWDGRLLHIDRLDETIHHHDPQDPRDNVLTNSQILDNMDHAIDQSQGNQQENSMYRINLQ
jgi:hypothetical protein